MLPDSLFEGGLETNSFPKCQIVVKSLESSFLSPCSFAWGPIAGQDVSSVDVWYFTAILPEGQWEHRHRWSKIQVFAPRPSRVGQRSLRETACLRSWVTGDRWGTSATSTVVLTSKKRMLSWRATAERRSSGTRYGYPRRMWKMNCRMLSRRCFFHGPGGDPPPLDVVRVPKQENAWCVQSQSEEGDWCHQRSFQPCGWLSNNVDDLKESFLRSSTFFESQQSS